MLKAGIQSSGTPRSGDDRERFAALVAQHAELLNDELYAKCVRTASRPAEMLPLKPGHEIDRDSSSFISVSVFCLQCR